MKVSGVLWSIFLCKSLCYLALVARVGKHGAQLASFQHVFLHSSFRKTSAMCKLNRVKSKSSSWCLSIYSICCPTFRSATSSATPSLCKTAAKKKHQVRSNGQTGAACVRLPLICWPSMFGRPIPTQKWLFKRQVALNIAKQQFSGMGFKKNKASQKQIFKASTKKILKDQMCIYNIYIYSYFLRWCSVLPLVKACGFWISRSSSPLVPWSSGPLVPWSFRPGALKQFWVRSSQS